MRLRTRRNRKNKVFELQNIADWALLLPFGRFGLILSSYQTLSSFHARVYPLPVCYCREYTMNSNDCKGENDESHCQSAIISQESENSVNPMQPDLGRKMLFRRKGKIVKESIYWKKVRLRDALQKRREAKAARAREEPKPPVQGRRIVDIALLAKHLVCSSCKQTLSLLHAVSETRKGLTSILHVRCHNNDCENVTRVPTSRHFAQNNLKSKLYAVNSDLVRGK